MQSYPNQVEELILSKLHIFANCQLLQVRYQKKKISTNTDPQTGIV